MDLYKNTIGIVDNTSQTIFSCTNSVYIFRLTLTNNQTTPVVINLSKNTNTLTVLITAKDSFLEPNETLLEKNIILNNASLILTTTGVKHYDINYIEHINE